jgi:hypothetical protein
MAMRSFLGDQEDVPPGLGRKTLEPYFMAVVRESSARGARSEGLSAPQRTTVRGDREPPNLAPFGLSSAKPVVVESSPDQEGEEQGPPQFTRIGMIEQELKSQRAQAEKSKLEFASMFKALQESLERVLPGSEHKPSSTARQVEEQLEDLPSTSASERVEAWRGMPGPAVPTFRRTEQSPATSICESIMSESLLLQVHVEDEPYVPRMLAEGQTPFDWDHDGAKLDTREDLSSEVKERLEALDSVARSMASINRFP